MGDPEKWVKDTLDSGKRIMGFGHRIYRAEDPRSRILKETARELGSPQIEIAERLEEAALAELERRHPERPLKTNVEYYSAIVLDVAEIPPPLAPAMFACSRVAGWSAHILEQKRTGRLFRPNARYVGPGAALARARLDARRGGRAGGRPRGGGQGARARRPAPASGRTRSRARRGRADYRERAVAYRAIGQFRFRQKIELLAPRARRREPCLPRLGADLARAALARRTRAPSTRCGSLLAPACDRGRQPGGAPARDRLPRATARRSARRSCCSRVSPRTTGSRADLRETATKVAAA